MRSRRGVGLDRGQRAVSTAGPPKRSGPRLRAVGPHGVGGSLTGKALGNVRTKHRPCLPCPPKSFTIFDSVTPLGPSTRLEKSMGRKAIEFKGAFWGYRQ